MNLRFKFTLVNLVQVQVHELYGNCGTPTPHVRRSKIKLSAHPGFSHASGKPHAALVTPTAQLPGRPNELPVTSAARISAARISAPVH